MIALYIFVILFLVILTLGISCFFVFSGRRLQVDILDEEAVKGTIYEGRFPKFKKTHQLLCDAGIHEVYTVSHDGLTLFARWIPADNAKGTVLIAHGYRSHSYIEFGDAIAFYRQQGMNLLLIDERTHGKSQGKFITLGTQESRDIVTWVEYHNRMLASCPVILHGLSMGAATVMFSAGRQLPENVRGIIADCGFTKPSEILAYVFRYRSRLPAWPFLWVTDLCARLFAGFSLYGMDSRKTLNAGKLPVLLIHGTADTFVPAFMSQQIYDAYTGEKELLLIEGAAHGKCFPVAPEKCREAIGRFLMKNLEVSSELRNYQKL